MFAPEVPLIVQVIPLLGDAVPQSGLLAATPSPGVRFLGSEAAHAAPVPSEWERRATGVVGVGGGASTAQISSCPARSLVKVPRG